MYDIYLWTKANSLPDLTNLTSKNAERIAIEERYRRVLEEKPGFLGLDIPFELAEDLLKRL